MREFLLQHRSHHYPSLIRRWKVAAARANLAMRRFAQQDGYWLYYARSKRPGKKPTVYLSAGVHGDEPGATEGLLYWLEHVDPALLEQVSVMLFPCLNPWGLVANSRTMEGGQDLNRSFQDTTLASVAAWQAALKGRWFDLSICMHEDYDAQGLYTYEIHTHKQRTWAADLVTEAGTVIPPDPRAKIDGRLTRQGVIRRRAIPTKMMVTMPESIYLYLHHSGRCYTVETPSEYSLHDRMQAHAAFINAAVGKLLREGP